jgi:hypothetical protein
MLENRILKEAKDRKASGEEGDVAPLTVKIGASWDWSASLPGRLTSGKKASIYLGI